jgi:plastocyanin
MGRVRAVVALICVATLTLGACASDESDDSDDVGAEDTTTTADTGGSTTTTEPAVEDTTPAASLRTSLNLLLAEHVVLASDATGAALGERTDEYDAAVAALGENSQALADAIGSVYGDEAGEAFLPLWEKHIGFFVDYTTALASDDQAAADEAAANLMAYAEEFGAFLNSATPGLPTDAVASLVTMHISGLLSVIDAQAAGDQATAYTELQAAVGHMSMIGDALAGAIAAQFPEEFPDDPNSAAATLQSTLNLALAQHVVYASDATGAALGGRTDEYDAAVAALGENSQALADAIGSVYGAEAGEAFLPLWEKHIGFFVDYTTALASGDQAAADEAAASLADYAQEFGAFLNSASPELPTDAVADLVTMHIDGLLAVIDAQAEADYATAYTGLREATAHMREIADALSATIVVQFPEQFPASAASGNGGGTTETTEAAAGGEGVVTVKTFQFEPNEITVAADTAVTWENDDDTTHEPTAGEPGSATGAFDVVLEGPDASGSVSLATGTYPYFCAIHESMTGTIVVE